MLDFEGEGDHAGGTLFLKNRGTVAADWFVH
jgi:hypothetical protein